MQLVILGRDGVINEAHDSAITSPLDWHPIRGSLEAIARLHRAGWRVVVAMNQPELAGDELTPDMQTRINETMQRRVAESGGMIDAVFFCPHALDAGCNCRTPAPGLIQDIARRLRIRLSRVPVIGDSLAEVQAAQGAGALPILVKTGRGSDTANHPAFDPNVPVYNDLYNATDFLLSRFEVSQ